VRLPVDDGYGADAHRLELFRIEVEAALFVSDWPVLRALAGSRRSADL
jgi:hypothetical protein